MAYTESVTKAREQAAQGGFDAGFAATLPAAVRVGRLQGRLMYVLLTRGRGRGVAGMRGMVNREAVRS